MEEHNDNPKLLNGDAWAEHEGYIIGNKEGLNHLSSSIQEALDKGQSDRDIGEFKGIKCLDRDKFNEIENKNIKKESILFAFIITAIFIPLVIVGATTVVNWLIKHLIEIDIH